MLLNKGVIMKKIGVLFLLLLLTGCTTNTNPSSNNEVYLTDMYMSCISPQTNQYIRNTIFNDDNCMDVMNFLAFSYNTTNQTVIKMVWLYNDEVIYQKETADDLSSNPYITSSYIEPNTGYLKGEYKIQIYIDNNYYKTIIFRVE